MKHIVIAIILFASLCCAQEGSDFRPSSTNVWGAEYPWVDTRGRVQFRSTLEAYQEDLVRRGLSEEEVRRKARIDLGQPTTQNEIYRDVIGFRLFDELSGDLGYGLRALSPNGGNSMCGMCLAWQTGTR